MTSADEPRNLNRARLIDALRDHGDATRTDLAQLTGLSRTTITTVVGELLDRGLLSEQAEPRRAARGRRSGRLRLQPEAGVTVGLDVGHHHLRIAVADLAARVLAEQHVEITGENPDVQELIAQLITETLAQAGIDGSRLIGAGVALSAPIEWPSLNGHSSALVPSWAPPSALEALRDRLGVHVEVANDANLAALGELTFGAGRGLQDIIYVKVAHGIGAGLVVGGRLQSGATGIAGELGHVQVEPRGAPCRCGSRGCLGTVAGTGPLLAMLSGARGAEVTLPEMVQLLASGDFTTRRVVQDAGHAIGRVLADLCNVLNPSAVIVGGELSTAGSSLLDAIRETIQRYALPAAAHAVRVVPGDLGERAEVLGAIRLITSDTERLRSTDLPALRR